ncbi:molybdenum cofactor guanylyltransferase [Bacteroidota bacterium]
MILNYKDVTGAILAGGKNTRMGGKEKALLKVNGKEIITSILEKYENLFEEILIVTNETTKYNYQNKKIRVVSDKIKNTGPIGGIHSALSYSTKEAVFVVACDMPFINTEMIRKVIDYYKKNNFDAVVPKTGNNLEPMFSIYNKSSLKSLNSFISTNNFYIRKFLDKIKVGYLEIQENEFSKKNFTNINTPEDLESLNKKA